MSMSQKIRLELRNALSNKNNLLLISANLFMTGVLITLITSHTPRQKLFHSRPQVLAAQISPTPKPSPSPSPTQQPTATPTPTLKPTHQPTSTPQPTPTDTPHHTDVQSTTSITSTPTQQPTAQPSNDIQHQILDALNAYRQKKGVAPLSWDNTLGNFAQSRADAFAAQGGMDGHAGFNAMLNSNGFAQLGFNALGENSSWGDFHNATYLIETMYAGDAPHDQNQLNTEWTHVGIGVNGQATDLVFGGSDRTK